MPPGWSATEGNSILDSRFATYKFMQLHNGQPGANGTNNVANSGTRIDITAALAASVGGVMTSDADIDWTAVSASETYTHCSFWSQVVGGAFGMSGTVTANPVSSGDNFRIPATQLVASVTVAS